MPTVLQLVLTNDTGDSYYRMRYPGQELALQHPEWRIINLDAAAKERFEWAVEADLLVLFQCADLDLLPVIATRRELGKKTLVEYNDNFYASPAWGPVAKEWGSPLLWQCYERFMREADGVIVTGPGLRDLFSKIVPESKIHILENHLPQSIANAAPAKPLTAGIHLGWGGSLGHMADLLAFLPHLDELCIAAPDLHVHVMGNEAIPSFVKLPPERFHFTAWGSLPQYYQFLKLLHLGIIPLLDTPYNRCRSDIKAVEMVGAGVLPVLPNTVPYKEFLQATQLPSYETFSQAEELLLSYARTPARIAEDLSRAYHYVQSNRIGAARTDRAALFEALMPPTTSSYPWPCSAGFHEIAGTPDSEPRSKQALDRAQQLVKQRQLPSARALMETECRSNPYNPNLMLALLRCLQMERHPSITATLAEARSHFPDDLRFTLFELAVESNYSVAAELWRKLLTTLRSLPQSTQLFFSAEIVRIASQQLPRDSALLPEIVPLAELYPSNALLHATLADAYLKVGDRPSALAHFKRANELYQITHENRDISQHLQPGYARAWIEALDR